MGNAEEVRVDYQHGWDVDFQNNTAGLAIFRLTLAHGEVDVERVAIRIWRDTSVRRLTVLDRLFRKTAIVDRGYRVDGRVSPCFEWTGRTSGNGRGGGYGRMCLNDRNVAVHKAAWTNEHGIIPYGKQIDHLCNNRKCWRDDHLEMVNNGKNQKRRAARAKAAKGA